LNLLLDIGNTSLRWVCHSDGVLGDAGTVRHGGGIPLDLLAAWESLERPCRVLAASVADESVGTAVARVARALWAVEAELVHVRGSFLGVRVAYQDPSRLGVDRWLALLGAHDGAGAALIVDAGTAVTYDLLLSDGTHLGGLILPGIEAMRASLLKGTRIGPLTLDADRQSSLAEPWAMDTASAVAFGGIQALGALAERLHDRLVRRCRESSEPDPGAPRLLITGGDAERLAPAIGRPLRIVPDLVLRGLSRFAEEAS
jgi:type III pantothenate kinase